MSGPPPPPVRKFFPPGAASSANSTPAASGTAGPTTPSGVRKWPPVGASGGLSGNNNNNTSSNTPTSPPPVPSQPPPKPVSVGGPPPPLPPTRSSGGSVTEPPTNSLPPPPLPPTSTTGPPPITSPSNGPPKPPVLPPPRPDSAAANEESSSSSGAPSTGSTTSVTPPALPPLTNQNAPPLPTSSRPAPPRLPPAASTLSPPPPVVKSTTPPPPVPQSYQPSAVSPSSSNGLGSIPESGSVPASSFTPINSPSSTRSIASPSQQRTSLTGGTLIPGELGSKRTAHRPSLSMGFNGMPQPIKKEVSTVDMMEQLNSLSPEEVAEAFLNSEGDYLAGLKIALDVFCMRLRNHIALKRELLNEMEITQLFANINNIKQFNSTLYHDLASLYDESPRALLENLGKTMVRFIPFFKLYTDYVKHYRENIRNLTAKRNASKDLEFFVQLNEMSTGRSFQSLLASPANRLAQYLVYLGDIYKKIDKNEEWSNDYEQSVRRIQAVTDEIAMFLKDQTARRLVVTVQVNVFDNSIDVVSPTRTVQKWGKVRMITDNLIGSGHSTEKVVLVLMNDMLLYGEKSGKLSKGKCRAVMQLPGMVAEDFENQIALKAYTDVDVSRCFRIKTRSHKPIIFQAADVAIKNQWLEALQTTIDRYASTMKRSVLSDQLQLACLTAEDFEKTIMKKKVDSKAIAIACTQAQSMAAANKANPLPPSPGSSPTQTSRRLNGSGAPHRSSFTSQSGLPGSNLTSPTNESASSSSPPPIAPPMTPNAPMAPPMSPAAGVPAAPPMAPPMGGPPAPPRGGPPPPPLSGGPPAPPAPSVSPSSPSGGGSNGRSDLLASIREGGVGMLKKVQPSPTSPPPLAASPASPTAAATGGQKAGSGGAGMDLNAALKSSLDRYRQFVQDEDDENDEWDD